MSLTGKSPSESYKDLLNMDNANSGVDATVRSVKDGNGTSTPLSVSTSRVQVSFTATLTNDVLNKGTADSLYGGGLKNSDLTVNGLVARTASGTYASRTVTGTTGQITVTNGDGVSGNPTLALDSAVTSAISANTANIANRTLQQDYTASTAPQIETTTAKGALKVKRGSVSDSDSVFEILDGSGATVITMRGDGLLLLDNVDVKNRLLNALSTGLLDGGDVTVNNTTSVTVSEGSAIFVDNTTDPVNPTYTYVSWPTQNVTVTGRATRPASIIGLDSSGTFFDGGAQTNDFFRDNIQIGIAVHPAGDVTSAVSGPSVCPTNTALDVFDLSRAIGLINTSGNVYSGNGTTTNKLNKSAGSFYAYRQAGHTDALNPSNVPVSAGAALTFTYMWRDGAGGWLYNVTDTVNFANYDNNTADAAYPPNGSVSTNSWSIQLIYLARDGLTYIQFGQTTYASLAAAEDAIRSQSVEYNTIITADNLLRGYLITRGGGSNLTSIADARFIEAGKFGAGTASTSTTSTTTLQQAYNNSSTPEITTDSTLGAFSVKRGSAADTDNVLEVLNAAGTVNFAITGNGKLKATNMPTYADDTAAGAGGLAAGDIYKTSTGELRIKL